MRCDGKYASLECHRLAHDRTLAYTYIHIYQYTIYLHIPYIPSLCRNICKNVGWALELVYGLRALELVYGLRSI